MWIELLVEGREIGLLASSPVDILGGEDRWALLVVGDDVVLVRGRRDAPER